jgi:hypothetical protein
VATYTIVSKQITANYGVVQTLTANEIVTGQPFTISGLSGFNGTYTAVACPTWVSKADVEDWLGFTVTVPSSDDDLLTICVAAANAYAYRKRAEAGYFDGSVSTVPSQDVRLGTIMYAGALYRERGSIDQFASFDPLATGTVTGGSMGQIMRLLGVNRPAVA